MKAKIPFFLAGFFFFLGGVLPTELYAAAGEGVAHYDTLPADAKAILEKSGWLQGPSAGDIVKAVAWTAGSIALLKYVNTILKRDKKARLLQLERQQADQGAVNPMAQLLRALQMQQQGEGGEAGMMPEVTLDEAQPVAPEQLEWNPHDILTPGKRKFLSVLSWAVTALAVVSVINLADRLKDAYSGNTLPSAVRHCINRHGELEKKVKDNRELVAANPGLAGPVVNDLRKKYGLDNIRNVGNGDPAGMLGALIAARNENTTKALAGLSELGQNSVLVKTGRRTGLNVLGWFAYKFGGSSKKR